MTRGDPPHSTSSLSLSSSSSSCDPSLSCGISFLDYEHKLLDPQDHALDVSHYLAGEVGDTLGDGTFEKEATDYSAFRVEVKVEGNPVPVVQSVTVTLKDIGGDDAGIVYAAVPSKFDPRLWRIQFIRLVTDKVQDGLGGDWTFVIGRVPYHEWPYHRWTGGLGATVEALALIELADGKQLFCAARIQVGRPPEEQNNNFDPPYHTHDIRLLQIRVFTFNQTDRTILATGFHRYGGTATLKHLHPDALSSGHVVIGVNPQDPPTHFTYKSVDHSQNQLQGLEYLYGSSISFPAGTPVTYVLKSKIDTHYGIRILDLLNQRLAQSTIQAQLQYFDYGGTNLPDEFLDGYLSIISKKYMVDIRKAKGPVDKNVIDYFIIDVPIYKELDDGSLEELEGIAYITVSGKTYPENVRFCVIRHQRDESDYSIVLAHETMHILLNSEHTTIPDEFIWLDSVRRTNKVIGPVPLYDLTGAGDKQTGLMRKAAEDIP